MVKSIVEAAAAFRDRRLSPVDLTRECLDRIERENPRLNAFYEVFRDQALAEARRAADELAA
ncbi:MAG TPA: hypothetical protein VEJ18_14700, partial [Planctomycetota bacterium]|nr:hypothetical protein [Planctomycetota bacterium]